MQHVYCMTLVLLDISSSGSWPRFSSIHADYDDNPPQSPSFHPTAPGLTAVCAAVTASNATTHAAFNASRRCSATMALKSEPCKEAW